MFLCSKLNGWQITANYEVNKAKKAEFIIIFVSTVILAGLLTYRTWKQTNIT